ncbi:MAG: lamin tail domain-containing protein [Proteobacteria bacterium]|nr:lamin tail domain-containing protein [Pseudomonadota bacterium]
MNKINRLMSLAAVSLCCMYGCGNGDTIIAVQGYDESSLTLDSKPGGCVTSADCGNGQNCVNGVCRAVENYCERDADCQDGYICRYHVCTQKTVSSEIASCSDQKKNGDESDVDCGGSCYKCAESMHCRADSDCMSSRCEGGICKAAVDPCADGSCQVDPCKDGSCQGEVDLCKDGVRSGDESDVDCGGSCALCAEGKVCNSGSDCASGMCDGVCISCSDGARNGDESDVDCGGSCALCAEGKVCNSGSDCASGMCDGVCISCTDGVRNGNESDVDCGGACGKCADTAKCNSKEDCASGFCDADVCTSCSDGIRNGDESDMDCGGRCGASCAVDKSCNSDNDCESYNCVDHVCKSISCPDKAEAGEIIINEVFSNPDTNARMQHSNNKQMKYIELYNKTDRTLQLYNLSLTFAGNEVHAKGCIPAQSYLIIHPSGQKLTALDIDAKTLASDNIDAAISAISGDVKLVKRADGAVIHSAKVPETEKGTAAGRAEAEGNSTNDEAMVPHSSVKTIESGVKNLYTPGLPNNVGFPMG